jgi:hypothetical protein
MREEEEFYNAIADSIDSSLKSKMFGVPCLKINKKAYSSFFQNCMVFKLKAGSEIHSEALSLDGSHLFDPSGKNRPMKEWIQVPYDYKDYWLAFVTEAKQFVEQL